MTPSWRRVAARLTLVAVGIAVALAASALAIRLAWCDRETAFYEWQSAPFLAVNPWWGTWHFADHSVVHRKSCFEAHYATNEYGMRGGPVRPGGRRIALLGDSFVEGFGLDESETAAARMQEILGPPFQVLNFGVSGYFTTIDEVALYENFARFFAPEVTVLFFLNYNDLEDALGAAKAKLIDRDLNIVYPRAKSLDEVVSSIRQQRPGARPSVRASCLSRFWRVARTVLRERVEHALDFRWDFHRELARPYEVEEDAEIRRSWAIVEASLDHLRQLTGAGGSRLLVVDLADPYQIDPNWVRVTRLQAGFATVSPTKPNERLGAICAKLGIPFYDMFSDVKAYIASQGLEFPYLSFSCDRHYDARGQALVAKLVTEHLRAAGLLAGAKPP